MGREVRSRLSGDGVWRTQCARSVSSICASAAATMALAGCLVTKGPTTAVTAMQPATSTEATRLREIAVLPFDGPGGRDLSVEIEAMLAGIRIEDKNYFRLAERQRLDSVVREIRLSQTGGVSSQEALRMGRLLGVRALYVGVVAAPTTNVTQSTQVQSVCAAEESNKKGVTKCKRWTQRQINCKLTEVSYSFTPKIIEADTGRIAFSGTMRGSAQDSWCPGDGDGATPQGKLLEMAKASAIEELRREVAPSFIRLDIRLMDDLTLVPDESAKRKLSQGVEFAKANRMDRACELWSEADRLSPRALPVIYNLGICAEVSGRTTQAAELYRSADRLLDKPDERVSSALTRVQKAQTDADKLTRQIN
jgi:hypothetical protein